MLIKIVVGPSNLLALPISPGFTPEVEIQRYVFYQVAMLIEYLGIPIMGLFLLLGLLYKARSFLREERAESESESVEKLSEDSYVERFSLPQVFEHGVMAVSTGILLITGLGMKFYHYFPWIPDLVGGLPNLWQIHKIFALGVIAVSIYHAIWYIAVEQFPMEMLPKLDDLKQGFKEIGYALGITDNEIRLGKYGWREKFDYWGAIIFYPILIITGLIMWNINFSLEIMPLGVVLGAEVLHSIDAIAASAAIMLHFYHVHFNSEALPYGSQIMDGKMSEKDAKKEHPKWFESIKEENE
ncbi:MAG: Formate dehydrogenase cytochrome b556 subunit [Candidatus Methanohalarchaeum thermophilum]|uniref:Formate dehydrogenase cytochrome b556 subunit n=1 Tax=Methanohalarchaeum thermophilum TaxID=1903181 RepID=A0A1Q6DTH0_METT1|nr:MAG: Formate dehydrogenase cytochrome b556 subunit [Candidatus Methanohalarchaeum thermophilum]